MSTKHEWQASAFRCFVVLSAAWAWNTSMNIAYSFGFSEGRQSAEMAVQPKCEFVYRNKKLINVTCPDSTGAMP